MEEKEGGNIGEEAQTDLSELNEYKKLTTILENELENKENKLNNLMIINDELKSLHDKTRQECNELSQRMLAVYNEKAEIETKYQSELSSMKHNLDKQRDIYEQQILKLSAYDPESLRLKLTSEIEMKFKQDQYRRELELDETNEALKAYQRNLELLSSEYEQYKRESIRELNTIREIHQNEIREILQTIKVQSEKQSSSLEKESERHITSQMETLRKEIEDLSNEIDSLRKEKEELLIEKNELNLTSMKDIDKERFHNKILIAENERLTNQSYKYQDELDVIRRQYEEREFETLRLREEKKSYESLLEDQSKVYALFKEELIHLRNQLEIRDRDMDMTLNETHQKTQMQMIKEMTDKEDYEKEINALSSQLTEVKIHFKDYQEYHSNELNETKRDYLLFEHQNQELLQLNRRLHEELESNAIASEQKAILVDNYEKDYGSLQQKYRALAEKEIEFNKEKQTYESKIAESKKEIKNLNSYIESLKDSKQNNANAMKKKYNEILEKKKYYKAQCKIANANIRKLISKLQPNEREIESLYLKEHELLYNNQSEESGV